MEKQIKDEVLKIFRLQRDRRLTTRDVHEQMMVKKPSLLELEIILGELCTRQSDGTEPVLTVERTRRGGALYKLA